MSQLQITYYTDPLCSWSWAFEPQWRRLRDTFGEQITWSYCMGGLIVDWQQYNDPLNDISRPVQMGPQWFQVQALSGMPFNERIWYTDPPASSYPACLAVKAAERQGLFIGEIYLRRLREAVMLEQRNISRRDVLSAVAQEVANAYPSFDAEQFALDLDSQAVQDAFREDLKEARYREIGRFPTLILRPLSGRSLIIVGYRPYAVLCEAVAQVAPTLLPRRSPPDAVGYVATWGRITLCEIAEGLGVEPTVAASSLEAATAKGQIGQQGQLYFPLKDDLESKNDAGKESAGYGASQ